MTIRVNPQSSTDPSSNDAVAMELDWTAPVYVKHTATTNEAAPSYSEGGSGGVEQGVAGIDYAVIGYDGLGSAAYDAASTGTHEQHVSHATTYYQVNIGVPGLWLICSTSITSYNLNASASAGVNVTPAFTCDDQIDNFPHDATSMWPTTKHFLPQYQLGSIKVDGAPYMSTEAHVVAPSDVREHSRQIYSDDLT